MTDPDALAEPYVLLVLALAAMVREEPPSSVHAWLAEQIGTMPHTDREQAWQAFAVVAASAIDMNQRWSQLTAWARQPAQTGATPKRRRGRKPGYRLPADKLAPCGTVAAATRHRKRGEPVDEACRQAERDRARENYQLSRRPRRAKMDKRDDVKCV